MSDDFDFDFRHLHEVVARDRDHDRSVSFVHGYKNDGVHRKCYAKLGRARVAAAAGETDADVANEGLVSRAWVRIWKSWLRVGWP